MSTKYRKKSYNGSKSLSKYLSEIRQQKLLTEEEEISLAKRIHHGDMVALYELINGNLRFVVSIAKQYVGRGLSLDDLINEGNWGLIKGAYRYNPDKSVKFISYAVWWVRQAISQALSEGSRPIRLPLNKVMFLNLFSVARNRIYQEKRREATLEELGDALKIQEKELTSIIDSYKFPFYVDSAPREDDNYSYADILADDNDTVLTENRDFSDFHMILNRILSSLSKKEREVICYFYGLQNHSIKTLDEIGHILGLTRERVRQLKESTIKNIRKNKDICKLRPFLDKNFCFGHKFVDF